MIATKPTLVLTKYFGYLFILCLNLLFSQSALAADYNLKFHHFLSANSFWQKQILEPWINRVEQNSNGRVSIEIFPSMTLGGRPPELVQQARDGVVDIIWTVNGYTPGIFPRSEVFELPTIFTNDPVSVNLAINDLFETELKEDYKFNNAIGITYHNDNVFEEIKQNELESKRIASFTAKKGVLKDDGTPYFSTEYLIRKELKMSEDEIEANKKWFEMTEEE